MNTFPDMKDKELLLTKSYRIYVDVEFDNEYYAGVLELIPEKITLRVMCDEKPNRRLVSEHLIEHERIECEAIASRGTIVLEKLKPLSLFSIPIRNSCKPELQYYLEISFNVGTVLYNPFLKDYIESEFQGFNIYSKEINDWVSETTTQDNLIKCFYEHGNVFQHCPSLLNEFNVNIDNLGSVGMFYKIYPQSGNLNSGVGITPYLFVRFDEKKTLIETVEKIHQLYNLFVLIIGHDFKLEKIELFHEHYHNLGISSLFPTLYYPSITKKIANSINSRKVLDWNTLFPLSKDLRISPWNLPELPLEIFNNYFNLTLDETIGHKKNELSYYDKYVKYKRMDNIEDRFLGFFRLLESLCKKEKNYLDENILSEISNRAKPYLIKKFNDKNNVCSFIKSLPRWNRSKYNTEKCIIDFLKAIDKSITSEWKFQTVNIGEICTLRNNITHANDYFVSEDEIEEKTKFIEVLLVISLFLKLNIKLNCAIVWRIDDYYRIIKPSV